ncbi:hypothetical protein QMK17_17045 [Rhodococcus sp. G-MC3]|uniref:hypothetical protein n=1 Tax=Rhodococcus sp. G-MC3 TaxID=3046209 RepID=UPI0024B93F28|nr:hypothetical protein [Rhodococcus sp. G-MC3]MDJ0395033.1 hypothetical protein [Rhodococcus sp. G-MC3]
MTTEPIANLLAASCSPDWDSRDQAASAMAAFLPSRVVELRLVEMHDADIAVQVSATNHLSHEVGDLDMKAPINLREASTHSVDASKTPSVPPLEAATPG